MHLGDYGQIPFLYLWVYYQLAKWQAVCSVLIQSALYHCLAQNFLAFIVSSGKPPMNTVRAARVETRKLKQTHLWSHTMTDVVVLVGVCMCVYVCVSVWRGGGNRKSKWNRPSVNAWLLFFITQPLFHLKINPSHLLIHSQIESTSYIEQWSIFIQSFVSWLQQNVILFTFLNVKLFLFIIKWP